MKKLVLHFSLFSFIFSLGITFGYSSEDLSNANSLADQQIIMKQTIASKYGLDNKILRQEAIGIALKVKGITLPDNYTCKKYFTDATKNDWICRAVELAADNGIITRSNKNANPAKYVTRAEALAMMMKAGNIEVQKSIGMSEGFAYYDKNGNMANDWQSDILETARILGIMIPTFTTETHSVGGNPDFQQMYFKYYGRHNDLATRAEVFGFTKKILSTQKLSSGFDKTYSNNVISFQYSSKYFRSQTNTLNNVSLKEEGNKIDLGEYSNTGDVTISIKYYENIHTDNDILNALNYKEGEGCKKPIVTNKETLSSGAITFTPAYSTVTDLCGINGAWKGLYFPNEGILVSILLGQDGQFEVLSTTKNVDYSHITRKFMETFRAISQ